MNNTITINLAQNVEQQGQEVIKFKDGTVTIVDDNIRVQIYNTDSPFETYQDFIGWLECRLKATDEQLNQKNTFDDEEYGGSV